MSKFIKIKSYAKVNLFLDIANKRDDGYHNIKSVMQKIDLYDEVLIREGKEGIKISCDSGNVPLNERNTCYKAADIIKNIYSIKTGINIDIHKIIPTEAGLGGGSSDAAAVIYGMNELFKLNMTKSQMLSVASQIGADVAFCLIGGTCLCEGIGDKITELNSFLWDNMIVIKPDFSISTPLAYSMITSNEYNYYKDNKILDYIYDNDYLNTCLSIRNTLEVAALKIKPAIADIKDELIGKGAISSLMTGSGSSVYGFFEDRKSLDRAYNSLSQKYNKVFKVSTVN